MLLPYNVDVGMERMPVANWLLIGVTIAVSIAAWDGSDEMIDALALQRTNFAATQLGGYMLLHAGPMHLLGNMMFLFCFGNAVNAKLGHFWFLALYAILGVVSGLAWLVFSGGGALIGASGAIMGIVGLFFILYPRNDVSVFWWFFFRGGTFSISSYWVILFYLAFDVWGLTRHSYSNVAYISHVTGAALGALAAVLLLRTSVIQSSEDEENLLQILNGSSETAKQPRLRR